MATIIESDIAKLTKDWLLTGSVQEMDRIKSITRVVLSVKYSI